MDLKVLFHVHVVFPVPLALVVAQITDEDSIPAVGLLYVCLDSGLTTGFVHTMRTFEGYLKPKIYILYMHNTADTRA